MQHESVDTSFVFIVPLFTSWQFLYVLFRMVNFCCLFLLLVYMMCCSCHPPWPMSSCLLRTHSCCGHIWWWVFRAWQKHHVPQFDLLETAPFTICSCSAASSGVSFICLSPRHTQVHRHTHLTIGVSFLPIPVTSCYSRTETGRQYPVPSDYYSTDVRHISEKRADPVKFFICGWEINIRIRSELLIGGKVFLFAQGAY